MNKSVQFKKYAQLVTSICLLCSIPIEGACGPTSVKQLAREFLEEDRFSLVLLCTIPGASKTYEDSFDTLLDLIQNAEDPLELTTQFFEAYVHRLNKQKGTSITIEEACNLVRQNEDFVPIECREIFRMAVSTIEGKDNCPVFSPVAGAIYWPWEWNWFGWNKKSTEKSDFLAAKSCCNKIIIFALFAVAVSAIAIYNAPALPAATEAMLKAVTLLL